MISICRVFSCVVRRGCLLWPVHSLGKTLLAFALLLLHRNTNSSQPCGSTGHSITFVVLIFLALWSFTSCACKSALIQKLKRITLPMSGTSIFFSTFPLKFSLLFPPWILVSVFSNSPDWHPIFLFSFPVLQFGNCLQLVIQSDHLFLFYLKS